MIKSKSKQSSGKPERRQLRSFSDVKSFAREKDKRDHEVMGMLDFKKAPRRYITLRVLDTALEPFVCIGRIWVKKPGIDKKTGKPTVFSFPRLPVNWDPFAGEWTSPDKDPYLSAPDASFEAPFYVQAIVRDVQEKRKKWPTAKGKSVYFGTDVDPEEAKERTPIRVCRLPGGLVADLGRRLKQLNVVKVKKNGKIVKEERDLTDAVYGRDIRIAFDPDVPGTKKYDIQVGDRSKLTEEELGYLRWNLTKLTKEHFVQKATVEEQQASFDREFGELLDGKSRKLKNKGKLPADDDDDDDDDDLDLGEDDSPKKKSKLGKKSKLKVKEKKKASSKLGKKSKPKEKAKPSAGKSKVKAKLDKKKKSNFDDIPF